MENKEIRDTAGVAPLVRVGGGAARPRDPSEPFPTAVEAVDPTAHTSDGDPDPLRAAIDGAEQPAPPPSPFQAVICANERTAADGAARHQAALLASPGGTVKLASTFQLTWHGERAFNDTCDGYDLLALGAGNAAFTALEYARIPTLIARLRPLGMQVTDRIVVCVGNSSESRRAVQIAGLLAAAHEGTVTIFAVPPSVPALDRAVAASFRVLLGATGAAPRIYGESLPPERTILPPPLPSPLPWWCSSLAKA